MQLACRLLSVAESGYYEWRSRPPSARAVRHAWLTEQILAVHSASRGTYGARRVATPRFDAGSRPGGDVDGRACPVPQRRTPLALDAL